MPSVRRKYCEKKRQRRQQGEEKVSGVLEKKRKVGLKLRERKSGGGSGGVGGERGSAGRKERIAWGRREMGLRSRVLRGNYRKK